MNYEENCSFIFLSWDLCLSFLCSENALNYYELDIIVINNNYTKCNEKLK